jgi:hypothetical protein
MEDYGAQYIQINPSGAFTAQGEVIRIGSGMLDMRAWGITIALKISGLTKIKSHFGKRGVVSDIKLGDVLDVRGAVSATDSLIVVDVVMLRNLSSAEQMQIKNELPML